MSFTIGMLARAGGVNVETVRYYQRRGLMAEPGRPLGGIRRYGDEDLRRLGFIKQCQALGFTLEEVADLLALDDGQHCREAEAIATHKLAVVRERLARLRSIEHLLGKLVKQCESHRGVVHCPLIAALASGSPISTARGAVRDATPSGRRRQRMPALSHRQRDRP